MDADEIRAVPWICGAALLPRLFCEFLRWQTLRDEGRVAANGRVHVAAILPELVPATLSVRLRDIPLRGRLAKQTWALGRPHADANPSAETCVRVRGRRARSPDKERTTRITVEIFV